MKYRFEYEWYIKILNRVNISVGDSIYNELCIEYYNIFLLKNQRTELSRFIGIIDRCLKHYNFNE